MKSKHRVSDIIHQPFWDKHDHDATFYCPNCKAPYYDHTEWGGNDEWYFDCDVCKKPLSIKRQETISYDYKIEIFEDNPTPTKKGE